MDGVLAVIWMFGGNFAPRNWSYCNGQLLAISQNQALFSLLGTTFGGDGRTTFALPDLRGRTAIHAGSGPGLTPRRLGQRSGTEYNNLNQNQMPSHTHIASFATHPVVGIPVNNAGGGNNDDSDPSAGVLANVNGEEIYTSDTANAMYSGSAISTSGGAITVGLTGASQAVNNMQPWECLNAVICISGLFPSRS